MDTFTDLLAHGLHPTVVAVLDREHAPAGGLLLPLQRDLIASGLLLGPARRDLLVAAPTASGKTLVAELAMLEGFGGGRTAWYLVPTRALAEQKADEFRRRWGPLGLRVACSTRERRAEDGPITRGERDIVVAVYEKALALVARQPSLMARASVLVLDELQILGDPERGPAVDLFLGRWRSRPAPRPRVVALSAVLGNAAEVAHALGLHAVTSTRRLAPLREGVLDLATGEFQWRDADGGGRGREALARPTPGGTEDEARWEALERLGTSPETGPLLLFCATRGEAHAAAYSLAERSVFPPATQALEALAELPADLSRERLEELLPAGIGLHTADLPPGHRAVVEHAFRRGELRLVVATPTLEQGVNLAAGTVVHSPRMMATGPGGNPVLVPLARGRLANQGGRAGRTPGRIGRSILFARNAIEADQLRRQLIDAPLEPLEVGWSLARLVRGVAELLAEWSPRTMESIRGVVGATLAARSRGTEEVDASLRAALESGHRDGFWQSTPEGDWRATALGEALARTGVDPATVRQWNALLEGADQGDGRRESSSKIACLFLVNLAEEWNHFPLRIEAAERRRNLWPMGLGEALAEAGGGLESALLGVLNARGGAPYACHQAARRTLLLAEWLEGLPVAELELRHGLSSGLMVRLATEAAWLAGAAAEVAGARAMGEEIVRNLEDLVADLSALAGPLLLRPEEPVVHEMVPDLGGEDPGIEQDHPQDPAPAPPITRPAEVRRAWCLRFPARDSGAVVFNGERVRLSPLPYQLLLLLAERAGEAVSYAEIHEALWPDAAVEQQMIPHHRRAAERSLGLPTGELVATDKRWGLRLRLEPDQVVIEPRGDTPPSAVRLMRDSG